LLIFSPMPKFYFDKRILIGFLLALFILSWLAISSYFNTRKLISSSERVAHTFDVLYNTERVLAITTNIELGQRGYTITGNPSFLQAYRKGMSEVNEYTGKLASLTGDNEEQLSRVGVLKEKIDRLAYFSSRTIEKRKTGFEIARDENATLRGKILLDSIRHIISEIEDEENRLLKARRENTDDRIMQFNITFISLLTTTGVILLSIFYAINVNLKARLESEDRLKSTSNEIRDLYDNAPCGYHSLDDQGMFVNINNTLAHWLGYPKEQIVNRMNFIDIIREDDKAIFVQRFEEFRKNGEIYDLEFWFKRKNGTEFPVILSAIAIKDADGRYVKSRSITINNTERKIAETEIKNLNHELEAFTYSVSHDLRAPLRSIDGYVRILQEDYSSTLDDEGKRVLNVVTSSARRMGKLIDGLLDFARLGRKELTRTQVNMTVVVNNIVKEVVDQEPGRHIDVTVHSLETAAVDLDMIRQVWGNLISNAVKYTGKKEKALIEVSSSRKAHEVVYCVKDNGVGFEMQYVRKLFGVFQRLHKIQDFSGTGVGLAIVKRIIERHGGEVWAEAKINEGASFYFTIPNEHGKQ
jgi:PAS domain S-box-containing protein